MLFVLQAVELMERILSNSRVSGEVVGSITLNLAMQVCVDNHDAATALSLFALMKDQVLTHPSLP